MFLNNYSSPSSSPNSGLKPRKKSKSSYTTSFGPFRLGRTIGQGEFGKVKVAYHLQTNKEVHFHFYHILIKPNYQVAIKFVKKLSVDSASKRKKLIREISIFQVSFLVC